jgi:hypothetical protein
MARRQKEDAGERRTAAIKVQLTPSERAELDKRAARTGRHLSDFVRIVLLSDLKAPAPTARDPAAIRALAVAINRVGANHDQILKLANQARSLPFERHRKAASEALAAAFEKGEFQEVSTAIIAALEKVMAL